MELVRLVWRDWDAVGRFVGSSLMWRLGMVCLTSEWERSGWDEKFAVR